MIFLHGLSDLNLTQSYTFKNYLDSNLFLNPLNHQEIGQLNGLTYIFPKAPLRPITVFDHQPTRGWFDIKDWRDLNFLEDEDGLRDSSIKISMMIKGLMDEGKIKMDFTILAGFSQGAVMSFLLTLVLPQAPFATLIMSGYPPLPFRWPLLTSSNQNQYLNTRIYFLHGERDEVLNYNQSKFGFKLFQSIFHLKFKHLKFKSFPNLSHRFSLEELIVVGNWIEGIVKDKSEGGFDEEFDQDLVPENELDDFIE
ncbi:Phospholipase/Carboxylesterase-domain-containing protein [Melampsora americana]|nr:Phospholipase/Carboxylesterase-domain-containing protein [Melampsora americana]